MGDVILLGPQRKIPSVRPVLESLRVTERVCLISAGWQEREGEVDELTGHLHCAVTDLALYRRAESIYAADAELAEALRDRQNRLKDAQRFYRLRLGAALRAVRDLARTTGDASLLRRERLAAMRTVRALDRHHLDSIRKIHERFEADWQPAQRPEVARQREALGDELRNAAALLIAGGNVQVLATRMRLLGIGSLLPDIPVIAWSAGAMALAERIVLFHDSAPHGTGQAEIMDVGLGAYLGVVPLPHASTRLDLSDTRRVALFARRFSPSHCVTMDAGARLDWRSGEWTFAADCMRLTRVGRLRPVTL